MMAAPVTMTMTMTVMTFVTMTLMGIGSFPGHSPGPALVSAQIPDGECDLAPYMDLGGALAEFACAKESSSETMQAVRDAAALATDACPPTSIDPNDAAKQTAQGYADTQSCECAAGRDVVALSSRSPIAMAISGDPVAEGGSAFDDLANSVRIFSEEHCSPGTKDGVLDQSAEECSVMSQGNATEQSTRLGTLVGEGLASILCATQMSMDPLTVLASRALGNATANAVSETEFACSFTPSVLCALSDEQVAVVARAQLDGLVMAAVAVVDSTCGCTLDGESILAALGPVHASAAVTTHSAVCESSQADFTNMADPIRDRILPDVGDALASVACKSVPSTATGTGQGLVPGPTSGPGPDSPPTVQRPRTAYPFGKCGSNEYARALADAGAIQVAPAIATACCTPRYECVVKSRWFAACRPMDEKPSPGWNGTVIELSGCA